MKKIKKIIIASIVISLLWLMGGGYKFIHEKIIDHKITKTIHQLKPGAHITLSVMEYPQLYTSFQELKNSSPQDECCIAGEEYVVEYKYDRWYQLRNLDTGELLSLQVEYAKDWIPDILTPMEIVAIQVTKK